MKPKVYLAIAMIFSSFFCLLTSCNSGQSASDHTLKDSIAKQEAAIEKGKVYEKKAIDTALYNKLMKNLANGDTTGKWPAKNALSVAGSYFPFS